MQEKGSQHQESQHKNLKSNLGLFFAHALGLCSIFQALYYVIRGFLDPVTREKLIFLNEPDDEKMKKLLTTYIPEEQLVSALSCRQADAPFDLAKYEKRAEELKLL